MITSRRVFSNAVCSFLFFGQNDPHARKIIPCSNNAAGVVSRGPSEATAEFCCGLWVEIRDTVTTAGVVGTTIVCAKTSACRLIGELAIQMHAEEAASTTIITARFKTDALHH